MTTVKVIGPVLGPDGDTPVKGGMIRFTRSHAVRIVGTGLSAPTPAVYTIGPDGQFEAELYANDEGDPSGTTYRVQVDTFGGWHAAWRIQVTAADAPEISLADLSPVGGVQIGPSRFDDLEASVSAHAAASTGVHGIADTADLITVAEADATYEPTIERLWIPAESFGATFGPGAAYDTVPSPSAGSARTKGWTIASTGTTRIETRLAGVPPTWATARVILFWTRLGDETAGDVRWVLRRGTWTDGADLIPNQPSIRIATLGVPDQNRLKMSVIDTAFSVDPAALTSLVLERDGTQTPDTYEGSATVLAVALEKVT